MTDDELLAAFESAAPPPGGLRHRDHLRVAWLYLGCEPQIASGAPEAPGRRA